MSIHFTIDRCERLVTYVVEGGTCPVEACTFFDAVLEHPHYRCGFDFFGDLRRMGGAPEPHYVYAVAAEVVAHAVMLGPWRWAVVVADDTAHDRVRMWAALAAPSGVLIHPFRTSEEAADWLGLPAGYAPLAQLVANPIPPAGSPGSRIRQHSRHDRHSSDRWLPTRVLRPRVL